MMSRNKFNMCFNHSSFLFHILKVLLWVSKSANQIRKRQIDSLRIFHVHCEISLQASILPKAEEHLSGNLFVAILRQLRYFNWSVVILLWSNIWTGHYSSDIFSSDRRQDSGLFVRKDYSSDRRKEEREGEK